ncbi:MAG: hypothetical protein J0L92_32390, partial [Deltaproteobacteria bacterium]|nr:hypothetical protein [Deltaproteobacteria bacterium]
ACGVASASAYYLWVHRPVEAAAPVTTESEPNDEPGQENLLHADAPLEGHLGARIDESHGDVDVFGFEVPAGAGSIAVRVSELPNVDLAVDVFASGRSDPLVVLDSMPLGGPEAAPNLPLEPGLYLARVHEVRVGGRYPIENVSDTYTVSWTVAPRGPDDEREWNDGISQAELVTLPAGGELTRRGFIGWAGDVDTYCLASARDALRVELGGLERLDLVLESIVEGRETTANEHASGEGESLDVAGADADRRVCVRVSAAQGAQRGDATEPYVLRLRHAPTVVVPDEQP